PKVMVKVKSNVTGMIKKLYIREGQWVKKGQPLAVIQPGRTAAERFLPSDVASPMDGVILEKYVEVGDTAVSGLAEYGAGTVLMTVGDLKEMVVKLEINEVDILQLKEGLKADVEVDAIPNEKLPGIISFVAPTANKNKDEVRVFRVEVEIQKPDPRLKPGMTARIDVLTSEKKDVLKAPLAGLFEEQGVARIYRLNGRKKTEGVIIKTGLRNEIEVEILEGLKEGDKILLEKPEKN
ncbi:MAG: efflux RND transporter periplasmic adaptor subunit, partial [Elusimicrobia bacterium]|nr:efflux RND transporter periplasmic adaptor subunit [Elusimicrobiota bacterium]